MRALVLGGSGTIGTAIVERLLEEGNEVIIQYFQSDLKALQDKYKGEAVEFIQADLTQNIDLETTFAHIKYLDCLIYSSGTALYGLLQDMSDIDIDLSYNIHVKQLIRCCRYFIDLIRQSEFGRIIVISSIWGETGASMETIYSAMKSAQIGFVKALSQELAMTNVTVNAITPGFVSGNMSQVFNSDELKAI
ncbi:MAG: SDR family NAD(P)-dependent oxidoreductase, partial [Staphylococcus sp.]|nr:SDR family NAD(P)-dependent oxidoreductase [Staphylococcus sp.]